MGEKLQVSDLYISFGDGEMHKLNVDMADIDVDMSRSKDHTSYSALTGFEGNMTINHMNKYEFFKMIYKYDKSDTWITRQYKHMKRCRNRNKLYDKRR